MDPRYLTRQTCRRVLPTLVRGDAARRRPRGVSSSPPVRLLSSVGREALGVGATLFPALRRYGPTLGCGVAAAVPVFVGLGVCARADAAAARQRAARLLGDGELHNSDREEEDKAHSKAVKNNNNAEEKKKSLSGSGASRLSRGYYNLRAFFFPRKWRRRLRRAARLLRDRWRLAARVTRLASVGTPLALAGLALYGLRSVAPNFPGLESLEEAWWSLALRSVEAAGPTFIKLCQWAATRNDLFPIAMTRRFAKLHDSVAPHGLEHTAKTLEHAFGDNWRQTLELEKEKKVTRREDHRKAPLREKWEKKRESSPNHDDDDHHRRVVPAVSPSSEEEEEEKVSKQPLAASSEKIITAKDGDDDDPLLVLGSGCIAQVYRGRATDADGKVRDVAVKVVHPGVRDVVAMDMSVLRWVGALIESVAPSLRYLGVGQTIDNFEYLMAKQLDLRHEAYNLEKLAALFKDDDTVKVPRPVHLRDEIKTNNTRGDAFLDSLASDGDGGAFTLRDEEEDDDAMTTTTETVAADHRRRTARGHKEDAAPMMKQKKGRLVRRGERSLSELTSWSYRDVLVEEYVEGRPICAYFGAERETASLLAHRGATCILRMLLHHNFVHGDLHPGNILVTRDLEICLLDAGICIELPASAHANMVALLRAMLESRGEDAARLMLDGERSAIERRDETHEKNFVDGIAALVQKARHQSFFESIGEYYNDICTLAIQNKVALDASFVSVALAVKIVEGIVLDLHPNFPILELAMPMFLKAHFQQAGRDRLNNLSTYSRDILTSQRRTDALLGGDEPNDSTADVAYR